jgi:hypothetical protein
LKCPANESGESAARVLLIAQALQVLDAIFDCLHVTEHHRRARFQSELMRDLHHFQPLVAVDLERRNFLSNAVHQDFTATARDRSEPCALELRDHFSQRHPESFGEMLELRRTESVNVDVRIVVPNVLQKIDVPRERQLRMMATLH